MKSIEVKGVSKRFGDTRALDDVSVCFEENKIYGLLGRNGAGKTTLLNIITGRQFADSGSILLDSDEALENDAALRKMYMLSEQTYYPEKMRVRDAFGWSGEFYPEFDSNYANKLSQLFELSLNKRVGSLSTGYTSIFKLITALSCNAPYLLLDEPVLGLDANHRDLFYKALIEKYAENPCCVVLSTHLVEEVSGILEHIVIIHRGRILRIESRDSLLSLGYAVSGSAARVDDYIAGKEVLDVQSVGGLKTACVLGPREEKLPEGLELSKLDLQRLFIKLTSD